MEITPKAETAFTVMLTEHDAACIYTFMEYASRPSMDWTDGPRILQLDDELHTPQYGLATVRELVDGMREYFEDYDYPSEDIGRVRESVACSCGRTCDAAHWPSH